ncbi:MAG: uroporphyrinogen decarboxylase [Phycisphaerae bacterium]|nr:uroporphyrinogen decarboxylase [Phycisphaerae bacterium]
MAVDFGQMSVVCFESRRAAEMLSLVDRAGGRGVSAPTLREAPLDDHREVLAFTGQLLEGEVDLVLLLTGVGTRMLAKVAETRYQPETFRSALASVTTVARGPKPVAALGELGLRPTFTVPSPNTWTDLLQLLDDQAPVSGKRVAVQEYGVRNAELLEALTDRGAQVMAVPIYRWQLPRDLGPVHRAIDSVIGGEVDFALVTSATQVYHLFQVAEEKGQAEELREAMKSVCIGAVGPVAARAVVEHGLNVDYEPDMPRMAHLVREMARLGPDLLAKKRVARSAGVDTNRWRRIDMVWPQPAAGGDPVESVFLKACRREPVPYTPVWLMRQAGRYQRAYREMRAKLTMLELCRNPEMAAEVTLMAVDRLGVDAAIIFQDILLPVEALGLKLDFVRGDGPVIDPPVRDRADLGRLRAGDASELQYIFEAVRLTRRALRPDIALIGFVGGPFTVASYIIEGGKSRNYAATKSMMYRDPGTWAGLMERLVPLLADCLAGQVDAGADAVQVFDSWAGVLCPDDYRRFVLPHVRQLVESVGGRVPVINFATGNPALLPLLKEGGGEVIGLDFRCDLAEAWATLGHDVAVMGNLDPVVLYASPTEIRSHVQAILDKAAGRPGHIFNLGHGILPDMDPVRVAELVDAVHELSARVEQPQP